MALKPVSNERKFEIVTYMFLQLLYKISKGDKEVGGIIFAGLLENAAEGPAEILAMMKDFGELAIKGTPNRDPKEIHNALSELEAAVTRATN